jgi:(p)ppGpp synthase/HD superfamily hydrolase
MVIHQSGCSNIKRMAKEEPQRVLPMEWEADTEGDYKASVKIELMHHQGVLAAITQVIASCDSNVIGFQTEEKEHNIYFIEIELLVRDRVHLATITKRIRVMDEVLKVSRHSQLNPV